MTDSIDMAELASFAVMSGAARLIRSFSVIPEGPMRDAVIHLAETTAATYAAHGGHVTPVPIKQLPGKAAPAPALRIGRTPPTGSPQEDAVNLRIQHPELSAREIGERVGLSEQQVHQAVYEARKAGAPIPKKSGHGVIPATARAKAKLDGSGAHGKIWHKSMDTLTGQGRVQVMKAAATRGITAEAYLERRQLALKLAMEGADYDRILEETGEPDAKVVSAWLSAARGAGYSVPYIVLTYERRSEIMKAVHSKPPQAAQDAPQQAQEPPPARPTTEPGPPPSDAPMGRVFKRAAEMHQGAAIAIHKAAQRRGMTVAAYEDMRESIVLQRRQGRTPAQITAATGQGKQFVKDTLESAEKNGVRFPSLATDDGGMAFEPPQVRERSVG